MEKKTMFMFGSVGLFALAFILSLTKVLRMSISFMGEKMSQGFTIAGAERTFLMVLLILVNLAAIALTLLPEFHLIPRNPLYKWIVIGLAGAGLLFFIIAWLSSSSEIKEAMGLVDGLSGLFGGSDSMKFSYGPSFLGWLLMLCEIGAGALAFLKTKEEEKEVTE